MKKLSGLFALIIIMFVIGDMTIAQNVWDKSNVPTTTVNGSVGIGTTNPRNRLDVNGNIQISNSSIPMGLITEVRGTTPLLNMSVNFREPNKNSSYRGAAFRIDSRGGVYTLFQWLSRSAGSVDETVIMTLTESGKLGIGTNNPTHELTVKGTVKAEELILNPVGADFVFEDDYQLRSLKEVDGYIQKNKHLPDIPSAEEMKKNGAGVAEFQTRLLQKVEELTLYLIELQKAHDSQNHQLKILEEENSAFKNRISLLENTQQSAGNDIR